MIRYLVSRRVNVTLKYVVETKYPFVPARTASGQLTTADGDAGALKMLEKLEESNENEERRIAMSPKEQKRLAKKKPTSSSDSRLLKVAIVGTPNAGKSTLANQLIGWKFAPVSQKVHTTRHKTLGVLTEDNKQVIFLDTPGLITPSKMKRHKLEKTLLVDPHAAVFEADLLAVVVDVSNIWNRTKLDTEILKILHIHPEKKSILIMNKVDLVRDKRELLGTARTLTEGIVAGTKSWITPKRQRQPDLTELFAKMKHQNKNRSASDETVMDDETPVESRQLCETDRDTVSGGENVEPPSDAGVSREEWGKEKNLEEYPQSGATLDRDPNVWESYYRLLKRIDCDLVDKRGWAHFDRVFMTSALSGDGIFDVKEYLLHETYSSPLHYHPALVTDQNPMTLARLCVFEKLLDHLPDEIPYQIKVKLSLWEVTEDNLLRISFDLTCSKKRHLQHLFGKEGKTIRAIAAEAKQQLMNAFRRELSLQLSVHGTGDFYKKHE